MVEADATPVRWGSVAIVASGPESDVAAAAAALGGAGAALGNAGAVIEDGRTHVSASGLCLAQAGRPAVVLTAAAALAPFLARRAAATPTGNGRLLRPAVDVALVPTSELFVILPGDGSRVAGAGLERSEARQVESGLKGSQALPATVAACVPLAAAEDTFRRLQVVAGAQTSTVATPAWTGQSGVAWLPPAVGTLGVAVLHVLPGEDESDPFADWGAMLPHWALGCALPLAAEGCAVRLCTSPFGGLKPSLFLDAETRGCVAGWSEDCSLLLLDARCLPGSEGGAVIIDAPSPVAPGEAPDCLSLPVALVGPPLRGLDGGRSTLGVAVPLSAIHRALSDSLPCSVLRALLGRALGCLRISRQLLPVAPPAFKSPMSVYTDRAAAARQVLESLCVIAAPDGGLGALALALSADGHVLVSKAFAAHLAQGHGRTFACLASAPSSIREHGPGPPRASGTPVRATVLHAFEGISELALVLLEGLARLSPLPWCLPSGAAPTLPRRPRAVEDAGAFQAGAEAWELRLPVAEQGARLLGPLTARGVVSHVATGRGAWQPALVESSFPPAARSSAASVLLYPGPPSALLALPLAGASRELPRQVLPQILLGLAAPELGPLLALLAGQTEELPALRQLDAAWRQRAECGAASVIWRAEAEPHRTPLRSEAPTAAPPRASL
uniref:Uncharacterized protein n=1 Tax=Alexandrium monilatum TaxID=311494 RepID=A0A7S4VCQ4_9DINO